MNVNGVAGYSKLDAYSAYAPTASKSNNSESKETEANALDSAVAAVYEKSADNASTESVVKKYVPNEALIEQLKADQEAAQNQLMSYVQKSLMGQGNALATSDDIWQFLASGNFTVDEAARAEAQKSLEDGGYWSVEKTSDRIVEFAKALTGGDPSKVEDMRKAIDDGFKEATKAWGKELPEITNKTYDAIQEKLNKWAEEAKASEVAATQNTEA